MRELKSVVYNPRPSPLPEGEGVNDHPVELMAVWSCGDRPWDTLEQKLSRKKIRASAYGQSNIFFFYKKAHSSRCICRNRRDYVET
jgi:hypothetical protein